MAQAKVIIQEHCNSVTDSSSNSYIIGLDCMIALGPNSDQAFGLKVPVGFDQPPIERDITLRRGIVAFVKTTWNLDIHPVDDIYLPFAQGSTFRATDDQVQNAIEFLKSVEIEGKIKE